MKHLNRRYVVLILLLTSFGCVESLGQESQKGTDESVEIRLQEIRAECDRINRDTAKFKIDQKDIFGQSAEGGFLKRYYDGKTLRKAILTFFGETGQATSECYFLNGEIIFVSAKETRYESPIYMGKVEIKSEEENQFYFKNEKLIRWIDHEGKIVEASLYLEKEKEILADFKNIL